VVFSEQAPVAANTYRTERGQNLNPLIAGISAGMATAATTIGNQQRKFSFVSDARAVRISNLDTSAFTLDATGMTIVDNQVSWATPASAGADLQGIEFAAAAGAEIECVAHNVSNGGATGSFYIGVRAVAANGGTAAARCYKFTIAAGAYQVYSGTTLLQTVIFNNEADRFNDVQGPVRVGIRVGANSRFVQLILNGKNYGEIDLGTAMAHSIFYVADLDGRNTIQFKYAIARNRDMLVAPKPLKIACLGDSITRGARSSNEWPQLLRDFGQHMPGIGQITELNNMAVSGISAATIAADIASYDFTGYDYALVMLGTNDCQSGGNGGLGAFFSNIVIIAQAIADDGAKPVFGVIPTYTGSAETGNGNATTNIAYIPNYQQVIRERILNAGYNVADVDEFFGNNYGFPGSFDSGLSTSWYNDNIHPNTKGQIAVAAAFAAALSRLAVRPVRGCYVSMIKPGGSFAINGEANHGILRAVLQGNTVDIHGAVSGGAAGQVIGALPVWARPAGYVRKAIFARTGGAQVLAGLEIRNDGNLVSGTLAWGTEQADLSVSFHV
jgi:lysophospholipase L1-like esterase